MTPNDPGFQETLWIGSRPKRLRAVRISCDCLGSMLTGTSKMYSTNAPADMRVVGIVTTSHSRKMGYAELLVTSSGFKEVGDGDVVPEFFLEMTTYYPEEAGDDE